MVPHGKPEMCETTYIVTTVL